MTTARAFFSSLTILALLLGPVSTGAAVPGDPVPGPVDPCVTDPAACPPLPQTPPPPPPDPFEPVFFGVYKLKVRGFLKHEGSEGFEPDIPQFPDMTLDTEEGYSLPSEFLLDPLQEKASLIFRELSVPIFEAWLAHRMHDLTGETVTVSLSDVPKAKLKRKKDYGVLKIKVKGTVTLGGKTHKLRYKSGVMVFGIVF